MNTSRQISTFCLAVALLFAAGCRPAVPEIFRTQLLKFLEQGAKTNAQADQGVSYLELREGLASTKASYDLLKSTWPSSLPPEMQQDFDRAIRTWDGALRLWKLKIEDGDEPVEPNVNGWKDYLSEFKGCLVIRTHEKDFIVEKYQGLRYLPFDENIRALLNEAGVSFNAGRTKIIEKLK